MVIWGKEEDKLMLLRAKLRKDRNGPYPLLSTNTGPTRDITVPCGTTGCNAILTYSSEHLLPKPISEFEFLCPRCRRKTYESSIVYNLN